MKRTIKLLLVMIFIFVFILPIKALADAAPGDVFITLGEDLNHQQKQDIRNEMDVDKDVDTTYVSNKEEHDYLGDYISDQQIGTHALSSAKITLRQEGKGIDVNTNKINYVSQGMYANALVTAGVKDAKVYVTAPFTVSGTAALTGILKVYDTKTDQNVSEEQKKVANEELVRTADLGKDIGKDKATELITRVKEEMANQPVKSEEDLRQLIQKVADDLNVNLTDKQMDQLVALFDHIKNLDIDWGQVKDQLGKIRDNLDDFLNNEETQSFFQRLFDFIGSLIDKVKSWF